MRSPAPLLMMTLVASALACGRPETAETGADAAAPPLEAAAGPNGAPRLAHDIGESAEDSLFRRLRESWTGDFDGMAERRVIRVGVAHSRTLFFLDGGRPRGLTYEALTLFERFINERLGTRALKVHVVIDPLPRDELFPAVTEGRVDMVAANLTVTPERLELVDFSAPFLDGVREVVVTGPNRPLVETEHDLAGTSLHVRASSSYRESIDALNGRLASAGLEPADLQTVDERLEDEDILELVNAGVFPGTIVDSHIAALWAQVLGSLEVHEEVFLRDDGIIAWAFRKESPQLEAVVNEFSRAHRAGTMIGNVTLRRYLEDARYLAHPHSDGGAARFETVRPVFERYAGEYGFDPLLLLAQGYQESGLDQDAQSRVGAVGVMQIMPATAADPNVGIPDISTLESNVHAGTKYLRFIIDRYFAESSIDPIDQHLLAFAAYNAGPGRIARLRTEAREDGLDPNVWFDNVERVVARRVGREPVQYVSNIFKYYMAYRTLTDSP